MLCRAKRQPLHGKEVEHTFRWSVRRAPWLRVCDADHMQAVTRDSLVSDRNIQRVDLPPFLRWPVVSWDGSRGRREVDDWRGEFLNCFAHAVATVATRTLGDVISRN